MTRTVVYEDALPFVAQHDSLLKDMGRQVDWANTGGATSIPAGTSMVIIVASGKMCPFATAPGAEAAYGILEASVNSEDKIGGEGHGLIIGGGLYENLLTSFPDADWATQKASLGALFVWHTYVDDRVV